MESSREGAVGRRPSVVTYDGVEVSDNLRLYGLVVAVRTDDGTGEVTVIVRTGPVDHQIAFRLAERERTGPFANAFAYAEAGDKLSLDVRGESMSFSITSPEGRVLRDAGIPRPLPGGERNAHA